MSIIKFLLVCVSVIIYALCVILAIAGDLICFVLGYPLRTLIDLDRRANINSEPIGGAL